MSYHSAVLFSWRNCWQVWVRVYACLCVWTKSCQNTETANYLFRALPVLRSNLHKDRRGTSLITVPTMPTKQHPGFFHDATNNSGWKLLSVVSHYYAWAARCLSWDCPFGLSGGYHPHPRAGDHHRHHPNDGYSPKLATLFHRHLRDAIMLGAYVERLVCIETLKCTSIPERNHLLARKVDKGQNKCSCKLRWLAHAPVSKSFA